MSELARGAYLIFCHTESSVNRELTVYRCL